MAALYAASANILVCSGKRSLKIPESVITTSILGLPNSSNGIKFAPESLPKLSNLGVAPIKARACAIC